MPRPSTGRPIHTRISPQLLSSIDQWATQEGLSRAEAIRELLSSAMIHEAQEAKRYG